MLLALRLCSAVAVVNIGLLKALLPLHFGEIWRVSKVAAMLASLLWLYALVFSWGTVVRTFPFDHMTVAGAATAAAGWLIVELTAGLLPPVAAALLVAQPATASSGPLVPLPSPKPTFDSVESLLNHVFTHGTDSLDGLCLEVGVITCSQPALACHASCNKTEAHRQLRQLAADGAISITADRNGTRIRRISTSAPGAA
jgi:hypothetical protein